MFEGQQIRLRAYRQSDLELARAFLNDPEVGQYMRPGIFFPLREDDELKWYQSLDANSEKLYSFAIELQASGEYIGGCGVVDISAKNRVGSVGLFLGPAYLGRGLGSDTLRVLVDFCFGEINLNKVKLMVYSFNPRAIRCYEKLGFRREGVLREEIFRHGRYHDLHVMGLLRQEWETAKP